MGAALHKKKEADPPPSTTEEEEQPQQQQQMGSSLRKSNNRANEEEGGGGGHSASALLERLGSEGPRGCVLALLCAGDERLGAQSPAALLDVWVVREIAALLRRPPAVDRAWVPRQNVEVTNGGHTLRQIPDCTNFVTVASPPVRAEDREAVFWEVHVDKMGSGTMRYAGLHCTDDVLGAIFHPDYFVALQTGDSSHSRKGVGNLDIGIRQGDVVGFLCNLSDEDIPDGSGGVVHPQCLAFFHNYARVKVRSSGEPAEIPLDREKEYWPAITQQTEDDTVTATFDLDFPAENPRYTQRK